MITKRTNVSHVEERLGNIRLLGTNLSLLVMGSVSF